LYFILFYFIYNASFRDLFLLPRKGKFKKVKTFFYEKFHFLAKRFFQPASHSPRAAVKAAPGSATVSSAVSAAPYGSKQSLSIS
jgi:hypothetical protein